MVDLQKRVQVGVVDEMQMAANEDRGWAWTRAVMGLPVEELHVCGEVGEACISPARRPREDDGFKVSS